MNAILLLAGLGIGALLGALIGYLYARSRLAAATSDLAAQARAADERARAAQDRAVLIDRAAQEKAALVDGYLAERFQALSSQALDASQQRLVEVTEVRLHAASLKAAGEMDSRRVAVEQMVGPLRETLARVEAQLREAEAARQTSHATLSEQVRFATQTSDQLRAQTQALVTALRRPEARGRWGEMQLRRVVELAGMSARCDFDEQVSIGDASADGHGGGTQRPDMVVRLAGGKNIVVDSKVSLAAYLEAAESSDADVREARLDAHARHLRDHVDKLAAKAYWSALSPTPEFVVLFIPGEAFLAPALERDPPLLEHAMARRVHIATPTTLITMLRTAQYAWQQDALSENARAVFDLGRELYERLAGLGRHVDAIGRSLTSAVSHYNSAVGSLETRVLVTARKLNQLGVTDAELDPPKPVEASVRPLSALELVTETPPELTAVADDLRNVRDARDDGAAWQDQRPTPSVTGLVGGARAIGAAR
jgi:DNA recombination protein RmuC